MFRKNDYNTNKCKTNIYIIIFGSIMLLVVVEAIADVGIRRFGGG